MYLWVVIAIFISALAALSSSLRPDVKDLYINTQAETETTQIYTLHRAVLNYINKNPTAEGEIETDVLGTYLPYGFLPGEFVSMHYCLNTAGTDIPESCKDWHQPDNEHDQMWYTSTNTCCEQEDISRYVITYGKLPPKWTNVHTGKPTVELLDAMKDKVGYVDGLGYSVNKAQDHPYMGPSNVFDTLNSDMGVVTQGTVPYSSIPQYIIKHNTDFKNGGNCSAGNSGKYCLVYITKISH